MPYILREQRMPFLAPLDKVRPATPGDLNFVITAVMNTYLRQCGRSYRTFNDIIGALECAKQEFYRRVMAPYEDGKCAVNGDVYDRG